MILNRIEFALMNNPLRRFIQENREVQELRRLSSLPKNKIILEIGCGSGQGTKLIEKYFSPRKIEAIDLDPRMIALAKKRVQDQIISFQVASATKLPFKDHYFNAVIDFGIIHHIPNWKDCLKELNRVLKPGGELILEDLSIETFNTGLGKVYRKVLDHPYTQMYTLEEFVDCLKSQGFTIKITRNYHPLGLLKYFVLVAEKRS